MEREGQIGAFSIFYIVAKLPYIFGAACTLSSTCTLYIYYYCIASMPLLTLITHCEIKKKT